MRTQFYDRVEAGQLLAEKLGGYANQPDVLVLGLPRGGVPVAAEIARALDAPLDVFVVRKLGLPGHEELAMGAIATGGVRVLNDDVIRSTGVGTDEIEEATAAQRLELDRREHLYREGRPAPVLRGRTVVLVDDGIATGATMRAAVAALRATEPGWIVVAAPVAPPDVCARLESEADELVCLARVEPFGAVGSWYVDFPQVTDEEVRQLLTPD